MSTLVDEAYELFSDAYAFFNNKLFEDKLPECIFTYQRQAKLMGYVAFKRWVNEEGKSVDELAINPCYFANYAITTILQTLCHEMVHIWQEYYGKPSRAGYHNKEWSNKMRSIGLMPSSTGEPGGDFVGPVMSDYVIKGGIFEQACVELLETGFKLKWYDTVQIPPKIPQIHKAAKNNVVALKHNYLGRNNDSHICNYDLKNFPVDLDEISKQFETLTYEKEKNKQPPNIHTSMAKNKSNRIKYYCPSCFCNVWGKPSLKIVCGECSIKFIEDL